MEKVLDLNIFYEEFWTKELGTWYDDKFTIDVYVRTFDDDGTVYNTETGILIKCDKFETQVLAEQFPMHEYGTDFWVFADEVEIPTRRIAKILQEIDVNAPRKNAARLTYRASGSRPATM